MPGIDCGTACGFTYPAGTVVTLKGYVEFTATAAAGSHFAYWAGCPQDPDLPLSVCKQHADVLDPTVHAVFAAP